MKKQLLLSSAMVLVCAAAAHGQDTEDKKKKDEESRLEKVTVSATFTEKKELETVKSVSIVGSEDISRRQANNVMELVADLPGVDINGGPNRQGAEFSIRGVTRPEQNIVRVDGVTKYFEGYRLGSFFGDPELLKQVDVVRGPVSTLYGSGAIGGVVNMTTKDASDFLKAGQTFGAKVKAGFNSNNDEWNGSAFLYARPEENIDLLGAVTFRDSDDFEFASGDAFEGSAVNVKNVLLKASIILADYHKLSASYQYGEDSGIVEFRQNDRGTTDNGFSEGLIDRELEDTSIALEYAYQNDDNPWIDFTLSFGYSKTHNMETGLDSSIVTGPVSTSLDPGETRIFDYKSWQLSAINTSRFSTGSVKHVMTFGADFYTQDRFGEQSGGPIRSQPSGEQDVFGAFIQDEINFADRVILTPAIRYATYTTEGSTVGLEDRIADPDDFLTADQFRQADRYSAWTPSVTAEVKLTDWASVIGGYYEGFRAPAIDEIYAHSLFFGAPFPPGTADKTTSLQLREETAQTWEAGIKLAFEDVISKGDILRTKLVYFRNNIEDKIVSIRSTSALINPVSYINDGEDRLKGWEFEGLYDNGVTYIRTSFSSIRGENLSRNIDLTATPADQLSISGGTRFGDTGLEGGFQSQFVWRHHTEDEVDGNPGYNIHNLYFTYRPEAVEGAEIRLAVNNLFDKDYRRHRAGTRSFGRDVRVSVSYQF